MKHQPGSIRLHPVFRRAVSCFLAGIILSGVTTAAIAQKRTTRAKALATVRAILEKNSAACKIDEVRSISAARVRKGWRVTAKLVMSASGTPSNETAVWTVRRSDGEAGPNNQLTAELSKGCP
jgi:hypothetical protein